MIELFNTILYQPIFNLLVYLYNTIALQDVGIAIIIITILIKIILHPLMVKSIKAQKALQELQPKMAALKKKYKNNQEALGKDMMKLYKQEKISPASSCLPLLVQMPFLIAVFRVFKNGFHEESLNLLYPFVDNPGSLDPIAFGFINLQESNIFLAISAGIAQYFTSKMLISKKQPDVGGSKDEAMTANINKQMIYFMPAITVFIGITLPGGLTFYWFITTLLTAAQQWYIFHKDDQANEQPLKVVNKQEDSQNNDQDIKKTEG